MLSSSSSEDSSELSLDSSFFLTNGTETLLPAVDGNFLAWEVFLSSFSSDKSSVHDSLVSSTSSTFCGTATGSFPLPSLFQLQKMAFLTRQLWLLGPHLHLIQNPQSCHLFQFPSWKPPLLKVAVLVAMPVLFSALFVYGNS